jgi:hypothetical protein
MTCTPTPGVHTHNSTGPQTTAHTQRTPPSFQIILGHQDTQAVHGVPGYPYN